MSATLTELTAELQYRRRDVAAFKHAKERYEELIDQAIRECPMGLWPTSVDTSTTTVAETRRYALSISGLTTAVQVKRIFMEDEDGNDQKIGRWTIEDDAGTLTLVLDEDPAEAGRTITIEFSVPFPELGGTGSTDLDRDWLCARAMTLLLMEADPEIEPADQIAADLQRWDLARQAREAELLRQRYRPARQVRSRTWR